MMKEDSHIGTNLTYLLIGGGIGAVLALLFAPKSGKEFREEIAGAAREGLEKTEAIAGELTEKAQAVFETTQAKAGEIYDTAKARIGQAAAALTENPVIPLIAEGDKVVRTPGEMKEGLQMAAKGNG